MKTNKLFLLAAMLLSSPAFALAAERVLEQSELPTAVRKTLDASSTREDVIGRMTVRNAGGRVVYDVELARKNASSAHVRIAEDGTLLADTRKTSSPDSTRANASSPAAGAGSVSGTPITPLGQPGGYPVGYPYEPYAVVPTTPSLRLEDLPRKAQLTIGREAANREIASIHEDTVDGRKAYAARFRETGRNPLVYVAEDGSVLRPTEKPPALLLGTTFSDTPAPVQQALRRELGDGEIVRIEKEKDKLRGDTETYQVEAKDARGSYQLRFSADGRVLENSRKPSR